MNPQGQPNSQDTLQKLATLLQAFGKMRQAPGGPAQSPVVSPERVTPLNIGFSTKGAGGTPTSPNAQPMHQPYEQPYGAQMMEGLDPHGQATFSAIQGVSQLLQQHQQRQEQKEQSEAANIAQNLMQAIESGDVATQHDILNDKHSTKILNKVYKGWLTKAQEAQQGQEPPDPAVSGFEAGIKQHLAKKAQGQKQGQPQPKPQPGVMGGYRVPQASPIQQLQAAKVNAELQASKQDPSRLLESQLTSQEARQMGLIAGQLQVSPAEIERLDSAQKIAEIKSVTDLTKQNQKDRADYNKALLDSKGKENVATINAKARVDAASILARSRIQAVQLGVKLKTIPPAALMKLQSLQKASQLISDILGGKESTGYIPGMGPSPYVQLQQLLASAGLSKSATELPSFGTHFGGDKKLGEIKTNVDSYIKTFSDTLYNPTYSGLADVSVKASGPTPGERVDVGKKPGETTPKDSDPDDPMGLGIKQP